MGDPWESWTHRLAGELATLREHEFVNTWGPSVTEERSPGLFGRRRKPWVRVYLPVSEAATAARLAARTYPVLGIASPDEVEMERGR